MASPNYIGAAVGWKRTKGLQVGTTDDNTIDFANVPYEGPMSDAKTFRTTWKEGKPCDVSGFEQLTLTATPTITARGPMGYAVLRFEGPAEEEGGVGGESALEIEEIREARTIKLFTIEDGVVAEGDAFNATYEYAAPGCLVRYTSESRVTAATKGSSLNRYANTDTEFMNRVAGSASMPEPSELVLGEDYEYDPKADVYAQIERGGLFDVVEWHSRLVKNITA